MSEDYSASKPLALIYRPFSLDRALFLTNFNLIIRLLRKQELFILMKLQVLTLRRVLLLNLVLLKRDESFRLHYWIFYYLSFWLNFASKCCQILKFIIRDFSLIFAAPSQLLFKFDDAYVLSLSNSVIETDFFSSTDCSKAKFQPSLKDFKHRNKWRQIFKYLTYS